MDNYKTCAKCVETKPNHDFNKSKVNEDGLHSYCRNCAKLACKAWRSANQEKKNIYKKDWAASNPEKIALMNRTYYQANRKKSADYGKIYRAANIERIADYKKGYRKANIGKLKSYYLENFESLSAKQKAYRAAHPEKSKLAKLRRRARKMDNSVFDVTNKELAKLYASPCFYCGNPSQHIDHVVPLSRGGTHSIGNLVGACAGCNLGKGSKFLSEWKVQIAHHKQLET